MTLSAAVDCVLRYHEQTKHQRQRAARSLGYLDWASQPDPFRRFEGAPVLSLPHPPRSDQPTYDALFDRRGGESQTLGIQSLSRLFYDSLALSAWKQAPGTTPWSLRVNPSSGALHPTEGYLVAGPIAGMSATPAVYHYAPYRHALEQRILLSPDEWQTLSAPLPAQSVLLGLTSIYWRESWKYGERAFRYCQHDVGHAVGAVAFAAASLGWQTRLVETVGDAEFAVLLGTQRQHGPEAEHPDCLLAVFPQQPTAAESGIPVAQLVVPTKLLERLTAAEYAGTPNRLSESQHPWPVIDEVSQATRCSGLPGEPWAVPDPPAPSVGNAELSESGLGSRREETPQRGGTPQATAMGVVGDNHALRLGSGTCHTDRSSLADRGLPAQQIIRQRRSAIDLDDRTTLDRGAFYRILERALPGRFPCDVLPWRPRVSLAIFVHRVVGLTPGLYLLARHPHHRSSLRAVLRSDFVWQKPPDCPDELDFWLLLEADCREAARFVSCQQDIAADGICSLGMLAEFEASLRDEGPWFYPRLFWETGLIGQLLYLEAEAAGLRGCGIGCFFDDVMHELLGIGDASWQSLYHFTWGGPRDDLRLRTIPPYEHLEI